MKTNKLATLLVLVALIASFSTCTKEENSTPTDDDTTTTWTITVGAFTLEDGEYIATGHELIFDSKEECQIWSRTAPSDIHSSSSHLHYNAAADVSYDATSKTFSWTEYGPEIDEASIESTCESGVNGAQKTVNDNSYYQDKPNLYLKITDVVEN